MSSKDIVFNSVSKKFESRAFGSPVVALNNFSYTFEIGKTTLMLGHNGAGKTTCLKILLGLIPKYEGSVQWAEQPVSALQRARIGYMPESNLLPANLSAGELLRAQYLQHGILADNLKDKIQRDLEAVGLSGLERRLARTLSKGQSRRLAWAIATAHDPDVLILDEPFSGLDPLGRMEMLEWLREKKARQKTLIFASHETATVTDLCDRMVLLRQGKLVLTRQDQTAEEDMFRIVLDHQVFERFKEAIAQKVLPSFEFEIVHSLVYLNILGYKNALDLLKWCCEASLPVAEFRRLSWLDQRQNLYQLKE